MAEPQLEAAAVAARATTSAAAASRRRAAACRVSVASLCKSLRPLHVAGSGALQSFEAACQAVRRTTCCEASSAFVIDPEELFLAQVTRPSARPPS